MSRYVWIAAAIMVVAGACHAQGDSVEQRLRKLEEENARISRQLERTQARNIKLEAEVGVLRGETEELREEQANGEFASELEQRINALTELAQDASWTTATKSGLPIRFYGFIRLDAYYNSARATDPIIPFGVLPQNSSTTYGDNESQFAFDSRLTRLGIDIDAGKIGSADVTAKLETDFANFLGNAESRETPRIRLAYINIDFGEVSLRFGQDWDIISPLYPAVNSELVHWGVGNLGDRRPMIQFIWEGGNPDGVAFKVEVAAGFPGAVDGADNDGFGGRTNLDGINSGHPHGQLRIEVSFASWVDEKRGAVGVSGYIARIETDTEFPVGAVNTEDSFTPWMVGLDLVLPLFGPVSLRGEAWIGQALSDIRGTILQDINTATGEEIEGWGGWVEVHVQVTDDLRLAAGASMDNPRNDDINRGVSGENRQNNFTIYLSSKLNLGGGLFTGLDVIYWKTDWSLADATLDSTGDMVRVNWWIQLNF